LSSVHRHRHAACTGAEAVGGEFKSER